MKARIALFSGALLALALILCMAQLDPNIFYQRQIAVSGTNFMAEGVVTNGLTLGGVRNTAWPGTGVITVTDPAGIGISGSPVSLGGTLIGSSSTATPSFGAVNTTVSVSTHGSGDAVQMYNATTPQWERIVNGTAASPDANTNSLLKVERTLQLTTGSVNGDGVENAAAIVGITTGTKDNQVQTVGVAGFGKNNGTNSVGDTCGVYGVGRITGSGVGIGIGGFLEGRRDTSTGRANGTQINVYNNTSTSDGYNATGLSKCLGEWMTAGGITNSGAAYEIGNPFGVQFDYGYTANRQVVSGITGGINLGFLRDDSSAVTSYVLNGSHTHGIDMSGATLSTDGIKMAATHVITGGIIEGVNRNITTSAKNSAYTLSATDETVTANTSGGAFSIKLEAAPATGRVCIVKVATNGNNLTVDGNGKNIDGNATWVLASTGLPSIKVHYDGTQWNVE